MDINIFDNLDSKIKYDSKFIHLRSYIFIADTITLTTRDLDTNLYNVDIISLSDEQALVIAKYGFKDDKEGVQAMKEFEVMYKLMKKTKAIKHKDKQTLMVLGCYQQAFIDLRRGIIWQLEESLKILKVKNLQPFIMEKIWNIANTNIFSETNKEDEYIQLICDSILHRKDFMGFDEILTEKFAGATFDNAVDIDCNFIKIPLWDVLVDEGMASDKIKYTRSDLQTAMKPFKARLNELKEELNTIQFVTENLEEIEKLCKEKILEHVMPVQQAIDNSIYLSHQRNQSQDDTRSKLYLGISSSGMLIDYLEAFEIIAPYVASEVRNRLAKQMDLESTRLFFYQQVHPTQWFVPDENDTEQPPKSM